MTTRVYQKGETIPIWAEVRNLAGVLYNPTVGVKITIKKPDGTAAKDAEDADITDKAMGKETTPRDGIYVYYYDSRAKGDPPVDDPSGWWPYFCKAIDGAGEARITITHGSFKLT